MTDDTGCPYTISGMARPASMSPQLNEVLAQAGPEQHPDQLRWQHAAVPAWCPVPPTAVREVAYTLLDLLVVITAQLSSISDERTLVTSGATHHRWSCALVPCTDDNPSPAC